MSGDDTVPATKADIQAILSKLDGVATKAELDEVRTAMATKVEIADLQKKMETGFSDVKRRLDLLNESVLTIVNNLANNIDRIDNNIKDHEKRLQVIGA